MEKRKEMPIGDFRRRDRCEPPFWHDGDGGGGGGGGFGNPFAQGGELHDPMKAVEQDLGGVELSASGRFIGEFGHIVGLVYDRSSDRLILIGDQDITLPPMDLSYFAVAEQLVSQGYGKVWFSLDPADPKNPRGKWMKCVWGPPGFPAEFLPGTPVGDVMFEADWVMKQYSFGVKVDEDGTVKPRMCRVPGFKDMFTLLFERFSGARRASWNRFWIVIGDVVMRRSGDAVVIEDVDVQVMTERMYATRQGLQSSGGKKDPEAEAFARFFEEHYDELAQEEPALAQLKGFGKVFALVKWLHAKGISVQMDSEWIKRSEYVQRITALSDIRSKTKRYRRGSALITETRTVHLFGGDEVKAHPVEEPDDGSVARLSQAVHATLRDRPSEVNMPVQVNRGTMMAVVLPLTSDGKQLWQKAKSRRTIERNGSTYHLGADGKVQYSEDVFGTQVHYHRNAQGKLTGFTAKSQDGWTVVATRQSGTVLDVTSPRGDTYRYIWDTDGYLSKVMVNGRPFARCSYDPMQRVARISYNGYTETLVYNQKDLLEKWIVEPTDGVSNGTCGSLTIAYNENRQVIHLQTDTGYRLDATYENGLVHSVRVGGAEVRFSWRDEERLASVRSANVRVNYTYQGENLRTISVQRGDAKAYVTFEKGLVKEAKNFSGGRWLCRYDQRDALIEVTDPTGAQGHYRYDADSRLIEVVLPGNGCIQYIYGQIPVKEQKGETAKSIQLLAVNYLPEGENASVRNDVRMWHTFPWRTAGFVGLGILLVLGGIWWWRRRQEMWW
ncbi:MAG TPA: hypothetical protein EYP19_04670 [Desulfobacterales bacterium]|nr:hypothetical protein [Desulfobacterales bacterium]